MGESNRWTTARLLLDPMNWGDLETLYAIHSDPMTWEHAPAGRHTTRQQTARFIATSVEHWHQHGLDFWTAHDRSSGGVAGVGGVRRRPDGTWNLYYRFAPAAWGRGLATELGQASLDAAHDHTAEAPVIAWILDWHIASQAVARKLGLLDQGIRPDPHDGIVRRAFADRPLTTPASSS